MNTQSTITVKIDKEEHSTVGNVRRYIDRRFRHHANLLLFTVTQTSDKTFKIQSTYLLAEPGETRQINETIKIDRALRQGEKEIVDQHLAPYKRYELIRYKSNRLNER